MQFNRCYQPWKSSCIAMIMLWQKAYTIRTSAVCPNKMWCMHRNVMLRFFFWENVILEIFRGRKCFTNCLQNIWWERWHLFLLTENRCTEEWKQLVWEGQKSLYVMKNHTAYIHATTCAAWLYLMTNLRGQEEYSTRPVDLKGGKLKERTGHALNGVNAVIQK